MKRGIIAPALLAIAGLATGLTAQAQERAQEKPHEKEKAGLNVSSGAFAANGEIPAKYTCDGEGKSPPLTWSGMPAGTKSVAVVVEDPDAPKGTFVHWVMYDVPAGTTSVSEGAPPAGAEQGKNGKGQVGWTPPCPPSGTHHYHFKVYALDRSLSLSQPTENDVDRAMRGHILAKGELVGTYAKKGK